MGTHRTYKCNEKNINKIDEYFDSSQASNNSEDDDDNDRTLNDDLFQSLTENERHSCIAHTMQLAIRDSFVN